MIHSEKGKVNSCSIHVKSGWWMFCVHISHIKYYRQGLQKKNIGCIKKRKNLPRHFEEHFGNMFPFGVEPLHTSLIVSAFKDKTLKEKPFTKVYKQLLKITV